ncbi:hypothetical protein GCM10023346_05320 [Arthrobacter gyeryongensis]|uniref:Uncharacterized protein n=1 Tax=Arthrobacter gyeryongensis TaxID=1650592 RepID=A0ABP9S078_9MICC
MDAFGIRETLIAGYRSSTEGSVDIQDQPITDAGDRGSVPITLHKYRTKRLILGACDAIKQAIDTGIAYKSAFNPPPQGARHPAKELSA